MKRYILLSLIAMAGTLCAPVRADFNAISQPSVGYTSATTLMNIGVFSNGTTLNAVTDGFQTMSFSTTMTKAEVPSGGWGSWGSPPDTESSNPAVLFQTTTNTLTIQLAVPSTVFGFELEGTNLTINPFQVSFFQGATLVGTITRSVNGSSGALLFAGSTTNQPFTRAVILNTDGLSNGFALAQLRYSVAAVPEPASIAMMAQAIGAVAFLGWRRSRKAKA
jgi:hypothetical protein